MSSRIRRRRAPAGPARPRSKRIRGLLAVAASLLVMGLAAVPGQAYAAAPTCPATIEFAVGGVGDPLGIRVPGTDDARGIVYPASLAPVGPITGDVSAVTGEVAVETTVRSFRLRCPQTAIHITGYSFGALVAGNIRDRWTHDPVMRRNMSFTLISDPRADEGAMARLPSLIPGFTHSGKRPRSTIPTSTVCRNESDFICHTGNPLRRPLHLVNGVLGYLLGDHGYRDDEITHEPGDHQVGGITRVVEPEVPEASELPPAAAETAQQLRSEVDAVAAAVIPPARLSLTEYIPTPLCDYLPPILAPALPDHLAGIVLPALPPLPQLERPRVAAVATTVLRPAPREQHDQDAADSEADSAAPPCGTSLPSRVKSPGR
ncbi:hypothetical protein GCM10022231_05770 [Gordonia caeni]|uniref:PE-PPE domain-containing protein n=1 Tax=Gordonia caeni TaxID=1007097 RepID=A0ABP7NPJ1_9ACTN